MKKRLVALIMVMALALSLVPVGATGVSKTNGGNGNSDTQIVDGGGTVFYDKNGNQVDASELGDKDSVVEMSKTVAETGEENEFEVTLNVKTNQNVEELSSENPDAAVVLVIDTSGSMKYCSECDATYEHTGYWSQYYDHPFQSRLSAAQSAAKNFLKEFSELKTDDEDTAHRWVQIISFDTDATREQDWIDVSAQDGLSTAEEVAEAAG